MSALEVHGLRVVLERGPAIVDGVQFSVDGGEVLGLVGESGSGKTTVALALLGFARPGARIADGQVMVAGEQMLGRPESVVRRLRGSCISYVPQDPATALNPSTRVGDQIGAMLRVHTPGRAGEGAVAALLERVHLPASRGFQRRYPHQLSGGQQQRLAIAIALACDPAVVVLDEPTTGLDVVTQARILEEVARIVRESGVALVYVSHDLAVVGSIAHRIAVMYAGRIVEQGPTDPIVREPRHPYTLGLISSVPDHVQPRRLRGIPGVAPTLEERDSRCAFVPRCSQRADVCETAPCELEPASDLHLVRCLRWELTPRVSIELRGVSAPDGAPEAPLLAVSSLRAEHATRDGIVVAADDVTFALAAGECLAVVGESGSGKTTIARSVAGLHAPTSGSILLDGQLLAPLAARRTREQRRRLQIVFQNPYDSLNPRRSVSESLAWPARSLRGLSAGAARQEAAAMLERVRLPASLGSRFPGELSGGERQRVAIARALAATPDLLVCDEVTSALDVSIQAAVLDLLAGLRREFGLAMLFITHDLGVVASVADRVLVLQHGVVREHGRVDSVLSGPADGYTRSLLDAAPSLTSHAHLE